MHDLVKRLKQAADIFKEDASDEPACRVSELFSEAAQALEASASDKGVALPRADDEAAKAGWKLSPGLFEDIEEEIGDWDVSWEAIELIALAVEKRILSALKPVEVDEVLVDKMPRNWELSWGVNDENDEAAEAGWRVHACSGGRNDREWTLIGFGETPSDALEAALSRAPEKP